MNVLYVGTLYPQPGGSGIGCALLLTRLAGMGHRVRAIAPITPEALRPGDPMVAWCPEVAVARFLVPYFETDPVSDPTYREEVQRHIRERVVSLAAAERPDVILVGKEVFALEIPKLAASLDVPWILRLGGHLLMRMAEQASSPEETTDIRGRLLTASLTIVQDEHMRPWAERMGCPQVVVIPNFVDLEQFAPRPKPPRLCRALGIRADDIVVLHASNMKPVKRASDVVKSAITTLSRDPRLTYLMVGDGNCRAALEDESRRFGIQDRFRYTGWVDYRLMPEYLALADIVVMPSEREQQARVYLETQASGRVLLASDIPAARAVIEDGCTGMLFRMGCPDDLAAKTLVAADDAALRVAMGRNARRRVESHSLNRVSARFVEAMEKVVEQHRNRSSQPEAPF